MNNRGLKVENLLKEYQQYFENTLDDFFKKYNGSIQPINEAIEYAIRDGGKRVRPTLCYLTASIFDKSKEFVAQLALGVEMIHSYSLVHDDLPCMDNDILRRGKPTAHIKYGEGMAVLAGDALLNLAFETLLNDSSNINDIKALRAIALNSGVKGMIGGQCVDIQNNNNISFGQNEILSLYDKKTSCLLNCAIVGGALKCGANDIQVDALQTYGVLLGEIFQIVDDILDITSTPTILGKSTNKDVLQDKKTFVSLNGIDYSKKYVGTLQTKAIKCLEVFGNKAVLLAEFCMMLTNRLN